MPVRGSGGRTLSRNWDDLIFYITQIIIRLLHERKYDIFNLIKFKMFT